MNNFIRFGATEQFEIAAKWSKDTETRDHLPLAEGWSTGELRITVGRQVLTEYRFRGELCDHVSWYLSPVIDWFVRNWTWLFHEESFAWPDKSGQPAAVATLFALERTIASPDETDRKAYQAIHAWWSRHALRAADSSAIYPDIYFRRVADDIEISWLARQPVYAPADFFLTLVPGYALLPVSAVAKPLWQFLEWATQSAPATNDADQAVIADLKNRFVQLQETPISQMEQRYVSARIHYLLDEIRKSTGFVTDQKLAVGLPVIEALDSAVLMFGGLNVDLEQSDLRRIMGFLAAQQGQAESTALSALVNNPDSVAWSLPHQEGYRLAEDCRYELGIAPDQVLVDMQAVLAELGIKVVEEAFDTSAIRGVAVAGSGFAPAILVNTTSFYNNNEAGKRFTLAHELCHILYDRTRARKLSHVSGPWAAARTEKRANAFAAMFLAPPSAIRQKFVDGAISTGAVRVLAGEVGMGVTALVEHLYNVDLINDSEREQLRQIRS
ncbi:MAG: ImmA/IrrE family metallo-endopeptidase [Rhodoferax sp.]|nr:ImmA/IrrE family metallo-endopeptidase [Rhodoferax sp.]